MSKIIYYTVQGIQNELGDLLRFSMPSFGRTLDCDFELEAICNYAAQLFYDKYPEHQGADKWPLTFKFQHNTEQREAEVHLAFAPSFQIKEGSLKKQTEVVPKKTVRKVKAKAT